MAKSGIVVVVMVEAVYVQLFELPDEGEGMRSFSRASRCL